MKPIVQQMQQDRIAGLYYQTDEERDELLRMGAVNVMQPPLPLSPCVKIIATGEIMEWAPFFAVRPDLCENCDEHGNTDPSAWQGRGPKNYSIGALQEAPVVGPESAPETETVSKEPEKSPDVLAVDMAQFDMTEFSPDAVLPSEQIRLGAVSVGLPEEFAKDFTVPDAARGPEIVVNQIKTEQPVDIQAIMQDLFAEYVPE